MTEAAPAPLPDSSADFLIELPNHRLDFTAGGSTLIVSFDNAGAPHREPPDRRPWGHRFFTGEGHAVLGVIARASEWFRCPDLHRTLIALRDAGFFAGFDRVVMTGSSMGGYGATAFAGLAPGCRVISYNPQSTLRRDLVPWDREHENGMKQDWSGPFSDGAAEIGAASVVHVFYDPFHPHDRRHAARYCGSNVRLMRAPFLGHGLPDAFLELGMLKEVMRRGISGDFSDGWYYRALRGRRGLSRYYKEILRPLARSGRARAGATLMQRAFAQFDDSYFRYREAVFSAAAGDMGRALYLLDLIDRARRAARRRKG